MSCVNTFLGALRRVRGAQARLCPQTPPSFILSPVKPTTYPPPHPLRFGANRFKVIYLHLTVRRRTSRLQKLCEEQARVFRLRPGFQASSINSFSHSTSSEPSSVAGSQSSRPSSSSVTFISFSTPWLYASVLTAFRAFSSL